MVSSLPRLLLLVTLLASGFTPVSSECTDCGLCYNHGGDYKCLATYSPTCDKWHAMFDCPAGTPCETTNDPDKGRLCAAAADGGSEAGTCPRCGEHPAIDVAGCCSPLRAGATYAPTPLPPATTTWSRGQAEMLPRHAWVVLDHNDGPDDSSFGVAVAVSEEFVWVGGKTTSKMTMKNPHLVDGRIAVAVPDSEDGDMFLSKVTLEGEPVSIHTFPGSEAEQPNGLAVSADGSFLSMVGYFRGTLTLGSEEYLNDATQLTDGSDCGSNCPKDAFLSKISAADSSVAWSVHFPHQGDASTELFATAVTAAGDIVYGGHIANTGRLGVLANDGVVKRWETVYDDSVGPFNDLKELPNGDFVAVGSLAGSANFGGEVGTISSTYSGSREALVLVLDAETGYAKWAALMGSPYQYSRASKGVLVATTDTDIYVACAGPCSHVRLSNDGTAGGNMMSSQHKGGIAKFTAAGTPLWISELPTYPQGMAANTGSAVYVNFYESAPVAYGADTFTNWVGADTKDQFIIKFDPTDGAGEWVMQQGGTGKEYVRRMAMDARGDIYTTGKTGSSPGHFDTVKMTAHDNANENDMFLAKMATSVEGLPHCKMTRGVLKGGYCFFQNTCFEDGMLMPPGDVVCVGAEEPEVEVEPVPKNEGLSSAASSVMGRSVTMCILSIVVLPLVIGNLFILI